MRVIIPSWAGRKGPLLWRWCVSVYAFVRVCVCACVYLSLSFFNPARPSEQTAQCFNEAREIAD